jgi:FkbM family methyltransferase
VERTIVLNVKWRKEKTWERLLRIERVISTLYETLTKPLSKYATEIIARLPFSSFFFRPLFLNEIYMALGLWEPYVRRNLPLNEGDVFIDIGAHIGLYTVYASQKVGKDGLVIAIEPDRRNLAVLHKNLEAIRTNNVLVYEAAAGFNGFLHLSPQKNPLFSKTSKSMDASEQNRVPSISLDSLLEEVTNKEYKSHSMVIKVDVEGGELDVIKGGISFLNHLSPILIVETWNHDELKRVLGKLGYVCNQLLAPYYICHKKGASGLAGGVHACKGEKSS